MQAHCPSLASLDKHEIVLQMHGASDSAAASDDGPAKNARFRVLPEAWPCTSTANLPLILISSASASRSRVDGDKIEGAAISAPASASIAGSPKTGMWVVVDQPGLADNDLRKEDIAQPTPSDIPAHVEAVIATITQSMPFTEPFVAPAETSGVRRRGAMRASARRDSAWESLKTNGMILGC